MKCKITTYRKYFCIGWFCLLIFGVSQIAHAKLKIYYMPTGLGERNLWRMDANGGNKELFLKSPLPMWTPRLSPDGKQILFTLPAFRNAELMVINLDGSGLRKLLADPPRPVNMYGEWSPDGKWIVYQAYDPDLRPSTQLYVTDAQGLNSFQIAADLEDSILNPFWFPDSRRIGFSIDKRAAKLHWVDADPNAKAKEMDVQLFVQTIYWSPNGKRTIVVRSPEEGARHELFLGDALGKNLIRLTDDAEEPGGVQWLPDSKHIVYRTDTDRPDVAVMNVATKEIQRLTDDGRSAFVFWHDSALAVEAAGKLSTSWGAIKGQVIDAKK
jgi:Tol biopolymer transport system component